MNDTTWFLVLRPWHAKYRGLCGDRWPLGPDSQRPDPALHAAFEASRIDVVGPSGSWWSVCPDEALARDYFQATAIHHPDAMLLGLSFTDRPDAIGFDFGSPEGGYSIVVNEIRQVAAGGPTARGLNADGLFPTRAAVDAYLDARAAFPDVDRLEDLDAYETVVVRCLEAGHEAPDHILGHD